MSTVFPIAVLAKEDGTPYDLSGLEGGDIGAGEAYIGYVSSPLRRVAAASFTRPADTTAYASGDLVANSTTAASVVAISFTGAARVAAGAGIVVTASIFKSTTTTSNALFRLHLFSADAVASAPANGDNGAFTPADKDVWLGAIDISVDKAFGDGAAGRGMANFGPGVYFKLASGTTLYGLLEARAAYAPGDSETFVVAVDIQPL
jgi:hypothetical protein